MANALDYISWRGDLEFDRDPVNEIDMFLFSQLATPDYEGIIGLNDEMPLKDVVKHYFELHTDDWKELGLLQSQCIIPMLKNMAKSPRFRNMRLASQKRIIKQQKMEQFEATTIFPTKDLIVVAFRGTDDTLIGWKEDMYLAVVPEVAAQKDALKYLTKIAAWYPEGKIRIVGHSKGGNLAIYSAVNAPEEIKERIEMVIGYDSPGFPDEFILSEAYLQMKDRIVTVLSQNSIVGVLMNMAGKFSLVKASVAGPLAHDGFNWNVIGKHFERAKDLSNFSVSLSVAIYETLGKMDTVHKVEFIEELCGIISKTGAKTVTDVAELSWREKVAILSELLKNEKVRMFGAKLIKGMEKVNKNINDIRAELGAWFEDADDEYRRKNM